MLLLLLHTLNITSNNNTSSDNNIFDNMNIQKYIGILFHHHQQYHYYDIYHFHYNYYFYNYCHTTITTIHDNMLYYQFRILSLLHSSTNALVEIHVMQ